MIFGIRNEENLKCCSNLPLGNKSLSNCFCFSLNETYFGLFITTLKIIAYKFWFACNDYLDLLNK